MKTAIVFVALLTTFLFPSLASCETEKESGAPIHHVVIVWLKEHGNPKARDKYLQATRSLSKLPMVLNYQVGSVLPGDTRHVVDTSYDLAIHATFKNRDELKTYLNHPVHKSVIAKKMKPLVDKVLVYDFAEIAYTGRGQ